MFERIQKWLDRGSTYISLYQFITGGTLISAAGLSFWAAKATAWLSAYGPIAWWGAALLGSLLSALVLFVFAKVRYAWVMASASKQWRENVSSVNPLESEFSKKRIKIEDLAHPITRIIENKRIIDCELLGPANIVLLSNNDISNIAFSHCDFVVIRDDAKITPANAVFLNNTRITYGSLWNCTMFVPQQMGSLFPGANFITTEGHKTA
jgi:hypothetical protein